MNQKRYDSSDDYDLMLDLDDYDDREDSRYVDDYEPRDYPSKDRRYQDSRQSRRSGGRYQQDTRQGNRQRTQQRDPKRNRGKKPRKRRNPIIPIIVILILILSGILVYRFYQEQYGYGNDEADLYSYFGVSDAGEAAIILNNERIETKAKVYDGEVYLDLDTVQQELNSRFYWGITDNLVIYCLPTEMVTTTVGTNEWQSDSDGTVQESYVPARLSEDGSTLYLALDYIKKYTGFTYSYYSEPNRVLLTTAFNDRTVATLNRQSSVRVTGGVKSEILTTLEEGTQVTVLEKMDTWAKVITEDGFIGYLENKVLENETTVAVTPADVSSEPEFTTIRMDGLVNMAWHNVTGIMGNDQIDEALADTESINVIAPTWFAVNDDVGDLSCYASSSYVENAHNRGLKVWAVVDNFSLDGVDPNNCIALLSRRSNIINQLMNYADQYGFDGINLDFETIDEAYGQDYIEFVRELSIACRNKGLCLSVDNYVPYNFNDYYHLDEQGVFADYVVIMGYDEHYAGSAEAGSVASIDYVKYGIESALEEVPKEKLINGIPFYTRLYKTDANGMTSEALDMWTARQFLLNHGQEGVWDESTQQNVVDFTENGVRFQMWLEDADSIQSKLGVMQAEDIAGVAEWKLMQETPDVWPVIASYVNGTLNN